MGVEIGFNTHGDVREMKSVPNSVLGRATLLLNAFRVTDSSVSLAELHRRTGIPKTTAHRLLAELVECELVERRAEGFAIGMRLFELGQLAPIQRGVREAAAPFLTDLFEATRETVHLAVLEGTDVIYLQKIDGRQSPRVASRLGGRMPAHCTGVGKAMLAFASPTLLDEVVRAGLQRRTPRTVMGPGLLRQQLESIRTSGVAVEYEESTVGIACVAAPVLDAERCPVAAVSITGWANRLNTASLTPAVRTAALGISRAVRGG